MLPKLSPKWYFGRMFIFCTVLRMFLGMNCLSLIQSVQFVNIVSVTLSCMEKEYIGINLLGIFFPFRNLISQIFKAFFCWVFMHKHTHKIIKYDYIFSFMRHIFWKQLKVCEPQVFKQLYHFCHWVYQLVLQPVILS